MEHEDESQPDYLSAPVVTGKIISFLSANKFKVELFDGQQVDAVMRDDLIPEISKLYANGFPKGIQFIAVQVQFREPPAMHLIVAAGPSCLCG